VEPSRLAQPRRRRKSRSARLGGGDDTEAAWRRGSVKSARKREIFVSRGAGVGNFQVMARSAGSARGDKRAWRACFLGFQTYSYTNRAPVTNASPPPPDLRLASAVGTRVAAGPAPLLHHRDQGRRWTSTSAPLLCRAFVEASPPPPGRHLLAPAIPCCSSAASAR
jgi:hypothetical protein